MQNIQGTLITLKVKTLIEKPSFSVFEILSQRLFNRIKVKKENYSLGFALSAAVLKLVISALALRIMSAIVSFVGMAALTDSETAFW